MFQKFSDRYGAEVLLFLVVLSSIIIFMFLITAFVVPKIEKFIKGNIRMTLGFYILTFYFIYIMIPYFFTKLPETYLSLYKEALLGLNFLVGLIVNNYFKNQNQIPNESK